MAENNIVINAKTAGAGISEAVGVGRVLVNTVGITALVAFMFPAIVPVIVIAEIIADTVRRWLGRN